MIKTFLIYKLVDVCLDVVFSYAMLAITPIDYDKCPSRDDVRVALIAYFVSLGNASIDNSYSTKIMLTHVVVNSLGCGINYFHIVLDHVTAILDNSFSSVKRLELHGRSTLKYVEEPGF